MYARAVDEAGARLRELRHEGWQDLALAGLALGLSVVAAAVFPTLAMPLFVGGVVVAVLGLRALWREWDLVERLADEHDAYVISEVRAYALRVAAMERRHGYAAMIRGEAEVHRDAGVEVELEALAAELDDEELELDPACAVACMRLLTDVAELWEPELSSRIRRIRGGFRRCRVTA